MRKKEAGYDGNNITSNKKPIICMFLIVFALLLSACAGVVSACETYVYVNPGESIQAAIDSICPEGGVVELAPGTWNITDTIVINKSNIVLRGAGMEGEEQSLIHLLTRGSIAIKTENVSNITIENLHITGEGGWANSGAGIYMVDSSYSIIQNVWAQAMGYDQIAIGSTVIYPSKATYNVIRNCKCDGGSVPNECWHGISLRNAYYNKVENNIIHDTKYTGIQFNRNCWHNEISNNTIYHAAWGGRGGITLHGACHWNIVENNHIYDGWTGIWVDGCRHNIIKNNIVHDNAYDGIGLYNGVTQTNNTIINNLLYNNGWCGIYVHALNDTEIISNTIYGSGYSGICIKITPGFEEYPCENIFIRNNIIVDSSEYGINNDAGTETVYISHNNLYNNTLGNYNGVSAGEGDISVAPLFADPDNGDFHLKSQYGRWNGSAWVYDNETSPCIDAGDPSEKDPDGTRINMGAYGGTSEASKSQSHGIETYSISGYVKYANGTGIYNAHITNNVTSAEDYTNESGYYILTNFANGTYNITASKPGFYSNSIIVTIAGANVENADIILTEDTTPPTISNVDATSIASSSATITWITDENSDSKVYYGETEDLGTWKNKTESVTSHSVTLTGLTANTTYYYQVYSTDAAGNTGNSSIKTFKTAAAPSLSDVIIWDTNHIYDYKFYDFVAFADKDDWTQVPYGTTDYTFNGDAVIENGEFYLFLHSNPNDCVFLYPKRGNSYGGVNEVYKVYDTGTRYFGHGTNYTKILKNTPDEVIVEHAGISTKATPPINVVTIYRIPRKPWIEVEPVENVNQQGMHEKSRLAAFVFQDVDDIILDADKHGDFIERINPPEGCIGEINFNRANRLDTDEDFMWFLTFPHGAETNSLTYQTMDHPDCYWEWDCRCCVSRSVSQNFAYLGEKVVIGVLNFEDNWKREDVGQYLNAGETYTSSFTAPYAGKWRVAGVFSDDDWNITDYFSEVEMNEGEHFTFTSPRNGTLKYLVMYMFDRTENTPENITTIMDVYREAIGGDITPPNITNVHVSAADNSATITWDTDEKSNSLVKYGTSTGNYTQTESNSSFVTSHSITLANLTANTTYYFVVNSTDTAGNSNQSEEYKFTTNAWDYIWLEAEDADDLTPDFEIASDASASNDAYIWIPEGVGFRAHDGIASYNIHVNTSGDYVVWGRVIASDEGNNSFFVQFDNDGFEALWTINLSSMWQWDAVNHWGNGGEFEPEIDPVVFNLSAGDHILEIKQREDGTKLDKLLITNNLSYVPQDEGDIVDTTPPASISDLQNTTGATWINWTWTNPSDNDFAYTMVYLDGVFKTNTSSPYYNATNLTANTTYEIGTHTVDVNGNVNDTWVNQTARTAAASDTTPPLVTNPNATPSLIPDDTDNDPSWGETAQLNVTVTDDSEILSVTINLSQIGGSPVQPMTNIGGNIWSVTTNASAGTAGWNGTAYVSYHLQVNATDIYGNSNTSASIELIVMKNGDIDSNGVVNLNDGNHLTAYTIGGIAGYEIPEDMMVLADVDGNGVVNLNDGIYLTAYTIGGIPGYDSLH